VIQVFPLNPDALTILVPFLRTPSLHCFKFVLML